MIIRYYELSCDGVGCWTAYQPRSDELHSSVVMREGAAAQGWHNEGDRDYCPQHPATEMEAKR